MVPYKKYRCEIYGNVADPPTLEGIMLHGIVDLAWDTGEGLLQMAWGLIKSVIFFEDTYADIAKAAENFDLDATIEAVGGTVSSAVESTINDYSDALGPNGCPARANYLFGKATASVAEFLVPASKIKVATKIGILNKLKKPLSYKKLKFVMKEGVFGNKTKLVDSQDVAEWKNIQKITDSNKKGLEAELFAQKVVGGQNKTFKTNIGDRDADLWDEQQKIAHEIKMQKENLAYTGLTKEQIQKDIYLMNTQGADKYRPIWHFMEAGPTQELKKVMEEHGIEYILYIE